MNKITLADDSILKLIRCMRKAGVTIRYEREGRNEVAVRVKKVFLDALSQGTGKLVEMDGSARLLIVGKKSHNPIFRVVCKGVDGVIINAYVNNHSFYEAAGESPYWDKIMKFAETLSEDELVAKMDKLFDMVSYKRRKFDKFSKVPFTIQSEYFEDLLRFALEERLSVYLENVDLKTSKECDLVDIIYNVSDNECLEYRVHIDGFTGTIWHRENSTRKALKVNYAGETGNVISMRLADHWIYDISLPNPDVYGIIGHVMLEDYCGLELSISELVYGKPYLIKVGTGEDGYIKGAQYIVKNPDNDICDSDDDAEDYARDKNGIETFTGYTVPGIPRDKFYVSNDANHKIVQEHLKGTKYEIMQGMPEIDCDYEIQFREEDLNKLYCSMEECVNCRTQDGVCRRYSPVEPRDMFNGDYSGCPGYCSKYKCPNAKLTLEDFNGEFRAATAMEKVKKEDGVGTIVCLEIDCSYNDNRLCTEYGSVNMDRYVNGEGVACAKYTHR